MTTKSDLDRAALALRMAQNTVAEAKKIEEKAKAEFHRLLTEVVGPGKAKYAANDGFLYVRTVAQVGGGLDFERLTKERPYLAQKISKPVLDPTALEQYVNAHPDRLPMIQGYALPTTAQERILKPRPIKAEDLEEIDD